MSDAPKRARPTPVRSGAVPPRPVREGGPEPAPDPPAPSRDFEDDDGVTWTVEVAGRSLTGRRGKPRADLLLLTFRRGEDDGSDPLEFLAPARELDGLGDAALVRFLADARRPDPAGRDPGFFDGTARSSRRPSRSS